MKILATFNRLHVNPLSVLDILKNIYLDILRSGTVVFVTVKVTGNRNCSSKLLLNK